MHSDDHPELDVAVDLRCDFAFRCKLWTLKRRKVEPELAPDVDRWRLRLGRGNANVVLRKVALDANSLDARQNARYSLRQEAVETNALGQALEVVVAVKQELGAGPRCGEAPQCDLQRALQFEVEQEAIERNANARAEAGEWQP